MKTLAFSAAAIGLAMTASPALAGPDERPRIAVSVAGLDLNTAEGQRMMDQRIERAARQVCRVGYVRTGTRIRSQDSMDCLKKARASAQRQVATIIESQRRGG